MLNWHYTLHFIVCLQLVTISKFRDLGCVLMDEARSASGIFCTYFSSGSCPQILNRKRHFLRSLCKWSACGFLGGHRVTMPKAVKQITCH